MAFVAYFGTVGMMVAAVVAVLLSIEPKPIPIDSRSLASASSPSLKTRVLRAESKAKPAPAKPAPRVARKAAEPADETMRELAFVPTPAGDDELEQALASADEVAPLPVPAPPRRPLIEAAAQVNDPVTTATATATPELPKPRKPVAAATVAPVKNTPRQVLRYVGIQDGIPTYIVVR